MRRSSVLAGVGALAFAILPIVGFMIGNPPGGNYSVSNIIDYEAKGHRPAVFASVYVILLSAAGLLLLLARLRDAVGDGRRSSLFWAFGVAAAAAWTAGYALVIAVPAAMAFGGGSHITLTDPTVYTFSEAGWAIMYGAGGLLLGCALLTFALGPVTAPAWVRWSTLVAGVAGLAALAWFPFFLVYAWSLVIGVWTLVTARPRVPEAVHTSAA